jgi:hypothetical protein
VVDGPRDTYDLESGLKPQFDITIQGAEFSYDAGYNSGQTLCLILTGVDSDGDEQRLLFPCSPGWQPGMGGQMAEREDGAQNRTFNQQSGIGTLIVAALQSGAPLRDRGPATHASVWPGLSFRFERQVMNKGTQYETTRPLPTAFLGVGQTGAPVAAPAAAPNVAAPAAPPAATAAMPTNGANGLNPLVSAKLKAIAKSCETHDAFIEQGLAVANGDAAVEAILADPNWYAAARA